MNAVAVETFLIMLREGLEALLVIAALAAFLVRAGEAQRRSALAWGAGLGVIASFAAAWIFAQFFGGAHDDLTEGLIMAAAALLLLYVGGWLWLRQDPAAWQHYLQAQTDRALAADGPWMLAGIAFLAVFREGAETILFLHAVANGKTDALPAIGTGLAVAALALAGIHWAMTRLALRLPLRPVFAVTSAFLFLLGLRFTGQAMQEFQEVGWISYTDSGLPAWAVQAGFNPSVEALGLQLLLLCAALAFALRPLPAKALAGGK